MKNAFEREICNVSNFMKKTVERTGKSLKSVAKELTWLGMLSPYFTGSLHGKAGSASQRPTGTGPTPGWLDQEEFLEERGRSQCTSMFWWYLAPTTALQNHKLLGTISRIPKTSPKCSERLAGPWHFCLGRTIILSLQLKRSLFRPRGPAFTEWVFRTSWANCLFAQCVCTPHAAAFQLEQLMLICVLKPMDP